MNTLNYIGCKKTLFKTILKICQDNVPDLKKKTFLDIFAGTGTIGYNMMPYVAKIEANDLEYYSFVINSALLQCNFSDKLEKYIADLNGMKGVEGLIYKHFSPNKSCERMFFTNDNAKKADAIRLAIENDYSKKNLSLYEYRFLLASLLVSIDKVANTTSVYGAYLKKFKNSALKPLILLPIHCNRTVCGSTVSNNVYNDYAENVVKSCSPDIIYIDPPYNHRQYSGNYSQLNYIAKYDSSLELTGKTGLLKDKTSSDFCSKSKIKKIFTDFIRNIRASHIILSYNNEGLLSYDNIKNILLTRGDVKLYKLKYNKFKAQKSVKKKFVEEYVWVVKVCSDLKTKNKFVELDADLL